MSPLRATTELVPEATSEMTLDSHLIGEYETGRPGPVFIFVGGMHGNEPSGVLALREVLAELEANDLPLRGRLVCLAGNLEALAEGSRYIDCDLNRVWDGEPNPNGAHEERVRAALQAIIEDEIADASEPVVFLDLHSTSAGGAPFSIIGDTRQNRRIAFAMPVPVILGLEEAVDGALLGYFGERGHIAIGFEGGQHLGCDTVRNHVAAVWVALIRAGALLEEETPRGKESFDWLRDAGKGHAGVIEMRYRHHVEFDDQFVMREGFANFDPVERGELLARDKNGPIKSRESGVVLLPLYQGQGQDGFFVGREVRRFWLRVSTAMRVLKLGRLVQWLPGVRRVEGMMETYAVNPNIARWWVVEIFHLLGFRRLRTIEGELRFSRRVEQVPTSGSRA